MPHNRLGILRRLVLSRTRTSKVKRLIYSTEFDTIPKVASWLNVAGMACTLLLLITFFALPKQRTGRHYLTIGLVVAVCLMQLGFIIPLGANPEQCHDAITPNDMYSDLTCAFSGAFLLFGGFSAISWSKRLGKYSNEGVADPKQASYAPCLFTYRSAGKWYRARSFSGHRSLPDGVYRAYSLPSHCRLQEFLTDLGAHVTSTTKRLCRTIGALS